ncbi:MAG: hypothetical protein DMF38_04230 [Verrucomicrobia bacterium]|nr:MAG: hypothetical protein DME78_01960 [Verrucomicrobiota bacterium]PYL35680.1 MAG: hypothetical protein DMF38_04230 [Verrucomicrobiota bacterium]
MRCGHFICNEVKIRPTKNWATWKLYGFINGGKNTATEAFAASKSRQSEVRREKKRIVQANREYNLWIALEFS